MMTHRCIRPVSYVKPALFVVVQLIFYSQLPGQRLSDSTTSETAKFADTAGVTEMITRAKAVGRRDSASADKLFRLAISKAQKDNDVHHVGKAYYEMGEMYFRFKNHNKSFGAFFNAKDNFVKAGSKKEIAYANFALGRQQYYRGNYKISAGHLNYAMREARSLHLKKLESDVLEYLGILYHVMPKQGITASHLLRKSLEIKQKLNDEPGVLIILQRLAELSYDEKKFDSAIYFNRSSLLLAAKLKQNYDANLARLQNIPPLLRLNKHDEARSTLSSLRNSLDTSDLNTSIRYQTQAGNYHVATNETLAAKRSYDSALQIAQNTGFAEMYALVYRNMADAYFYANDFKKAYECQREYSTKMASLYSADNYTALGELQFILKTNVTEDEVKYLSSQNEVKELRLKTERTLSLILLLSAFGFLVSAVIIFLLYKKQKRKSNIIEKQSLDLQILMKEIHHRVKNNLQVISSLLDLQSQTVENNEASEAIKESRNRVQTMALIHQDLYNESNVKGIEMRDYIHKLATSLFSSYNVKKTEVILETNIEPLWLDIEVVIPIGFVLNELISNALKYAFPGKVTGIITITIERNSGELILKVKDNGVGFPQGLNIYQAKSFGYKLIKAFAQKLKARLEVYNDNGACILLHIRKYNINLGT